MADFSKDVGSVKSSQDRDIQILSEYNKDRIEGDKEYYKKVSKMSLEYQRFYLDLQEERFEEQRRLQEESHKKALNDLQKQYHVEHSIDKKAYDAKFKELTDSYNLQKKHNTELAKLQDTNGKSSIQIRKQIREIEKQIKSDQKEFSEEELNNIKSRLDSEKQLTKEKEKQEAADKRKQSLEKVASSLLSNSEAADKAFSRAETVLNEYQSRMDARLQGTQQSFKQISNDFSNVVSKLPITTQNQLLSKANELLNKGITYNVEQRAFIASVAEEVVSSFEATRAGLLQLVRVQSEDSTAARLGLQSQLQTYLNQNYLDTSYLSDMFNSVASALTATEARMGTKEATEFEYVVQKWLGAMYSSGMDSGTISTIASAINKLGTGDVSGLSESERNLLAMSASRSGELSFAKLLTDGLNSSNIDTLMKSMVGYLKEIASETKSNNVVAKAYGNVFGFSTTDLAAIEKLNISGIYGSNSNYASMLNEAGTQTTEGILSRTSTGKLISNLLSNLTFGAASNLVNNPVTYLAYKALGLLQGINGSAGSPLTLKNAFLDVNLDIPSILKNGMFGVSFLQELLTNGTSALNSLITNVGSRTGALSLGSTSYYDSELGKLGLLGETYKQGNGSRLDATSSLSTAIVKTNASDIDTQSIATSVTQAENKYKSITGADEESSIEYTLTDMYKALFSDSSEGQLTTLAADVSSLNNKLENIYQSADRSTRVVITGVDITSDAGLPIEFTEKGKTGLKNSLEKVLQQLMQNQEYILTLLSHFATEDGNGVDVNLIGSDISLQSMVTNTAVYNAETSRGTYADYSRIR